jgi:hypothetical protein
MGGFGVFSGIHAGIAGRAREGSIGRSLPGSAKASAQVGSVRNPSCEQALPVSWLNSIRSLEQGAFEGRVCGAAKRA